MIMTRPRPSTNGVNAIFRNLNKHNIGTLLYGGTLPKKIVEDGILDAIEPWCEKKDAMNENNKEADQILKEIQPIDRGNKKDRLAR